MLYRKNVEVVPNSDLLLKQPIFLIEKLMIFMQRRKIEPYFLQRSTADDRDKMNSGPISKWK